MREVEDAHQPVDQREAGGDQEVERAEAEAGDGEKDERAHAGVPHAEHAVHHRLVREQLLRGPDVDDAAGVEHDRVACDALDDSEVLLDEQHRRELARRVRARRRPA